MQSLAILHDSIRALKSRYLFWITLAISLLASVALFGTIGFTEDGWRVLWFEPSPSDLYRAGSPGARDMMAWIFNGIYVRWWLSWAAIVLALISTASIIPDFLAPGAVELSLSKPISRLKLLSLKFAGAMLFVALQITIGVVAAWLLMGIKVGIWITVAFWAIPLITIQFFYLYSIATFVAVVTRSTLASLLVTLIAWATFSSVQFTSNQLDSNVVQMDTVVREMEERVDRMRSRADAENRSLLPMEVARITSFEEQIETFRGIGQTIRPWQVQIHKVEAILPKTGDIQKILANTAEAPVLNELLENSQALRNASGVGDDVEFEVMMESGIAGQKAIRAVNPKTSILSSLVQPLAAVIAAVVVFLRRDY